MLRRTGRYPVRTGWLYLMNPSVEALWYSLAKDLDLTHKLTIKELLELIKRHKLGEIYHRDSRANYLQVRLLVPYSIAKQVVKDNW